MFFYRLKEEYRALAEQNVILNHSLEAQMLQGDSESESLELNECRMQRDQIFRNVSWNFFLYSILLFMLRVMYSVVILSEARNFL
jgi:hypothetical protein